VNASQECKRIAAVLFARTERAEGIYVQLIAARARVAPMEKITTPRLELLAATIGVRLWYSIKDALDIKKADVSFWSDSTTVLVLIKRDKPWNIFVSLIE